MSRAVELMVAHVESLRRRHDKNVAELEEMKKMMQQHPSSYRNSINPATSPGCFLCIFIYLHWSVAHSDSGLLVAEPEEYDMMKNSKQVCLYPSSMISGVFLTS